MGDFFTKQSVGKNPTRSPIIENPLMQDLPRCKFYKNQSYLRCSDCKEGRDYNCPYIDLGTKFFKRNTDNGGEDSVNRH